MTRAGRRGCGSTDLGCSLTAAGTVQVDGGKGVIERRLSPAGLPVTSKAGRSPG